MFKFLPKTFTPVKDNTRLTCVNTQIIILLVSLLLVTILVLIVNWKRNLKLFKITSLGQMSLSEICLLCLMALMIAEEFGFVLGFAKIEWKYFLLYFVINFLLNIFTKIVFCYFFWLIFYLIFFFQ